VANLKTFKVLSSHAEIAIFLSELRATWRTGPVCPPKVMMHGSGFSALLFHVMYGRVSCLVTWDLRG
jgi:hypothetical protein